MTSSAAMEDRLRQLEKHLYKTVKEACVTHRLLEPGDRILVALSGGKDSYTMLTVLDKLVPRLPFEVSLVAVHLDQKQPGYDGAPLRAWLADRGGEYNVLSEDTYSVVTEHIDDASTYCSLCSRLRRGILYTAAERLGCNKLALGHHRDDSLETFLMNLFYAGKMQAMPAKYTTDDGRFEVIRPLIDCAEDRIAEYAALARFPILPCNLCGSQDGLKRDAMTKLLGELEQHHPNVRNVMWRALHNVRPTHLLDSDVLEAWKTRAPEVRPDAPAAKKREHHAAEPVLVGAGPRRLPVVPS